MASDFVPSPMGLGLCLLFVSMSIAAAIDSQRDTVSVIMPTNLAESVGNHGKIPAKPALFGKFYYGRILDAPFSLLKQNQTDTDYVACQRFNMDVEDLDRPFIALVRRGGGCTFVQKAQNVQNAGAAALVIVNDATTEPDYMGISQNEYGISSTIDIPVMMIRQASGEQIIRAVESGMEPGKEPTKVRGQLQVLKPNPTMNQRLNVDLFLRLDGIPADFMKTFSLALTSLGGTVNPSVHFILDEWKGWRDPESCTNNKRYCARNRDVVAETLRQLCIFKKNGWESWISYYNDWMGKCGSNNDFSGACFRQIYNDVKSVESCVAESGGLDADQNNDLLEAQLRDPRQIKYAPLLIINDAVFESQLTCNSVHDCAPLSFLCMMFADSDQPSACFTSSACESFGEVPDVCGTCRPWGDAAAVSDPSKCHTAASQPRVRFVTILMIFLLLTLFVFLVIVSINRHLRNSMRHEVDAIMNEYTPLRDTDLDASFATTKRPYRIPAA